MNHPLNEEDFGTKRATTNDRIEITLGENTPNRRVKTKRISDLMSFKREKQNNKLKKKPKKKERETRALSGN